jgi:hypothetical protein
VLAVDATVVAGTSWGPTLMPFFATAAGLVVAVTVAVLVKSVPGLLLALAPLLYVVWSTIRYVLLPLTSTRGWPVSTGHRAESPYSVRDHCWLVPVPQVYCWMSAPSAVEPLTTSRHLPLWRAFNWK